MAEAPLLPPEQAKSLLLDYYHCTFFLPIQGVLEAFRPRMDPRLYDVHNQDEDDIQAWLYFADTQRHLLFQDRIDSRRHPLPIQEWRLPKNEVAGLQLHLGKEKYRLETPATEEEKARHALNYQIARIVSVRLFRYFNGIHLLAVTVRPHQLEMLRAEQQRLRRKRLETLSQSAAADGREREVEEWLGEHGIPLFRNHCPATLGEAREKYGDDADGYEQLQLEAWLRFTRLARQLYLGFAEQKLEGKYIPLWLFEQDGEKDEPVLREKAFDTPSQMVIPNSPGDRLNAIVQHLLCRFYPEQDRPEIQRAMRRRLKPDDDRMFVSVAYGLTGSTPPDGGPLELDRLFSLMLYVDRLEDAWVEGWAYSPQIVQERMRQARFDLWADAGLLYGYTDFSNAALGRGAFFRDIIAPRHILPIYDRMLTQALFYRESLRLYDAQICAQTSEIVDRDKLGHMRRQRKEFIRFTNQYWFRDLTEQMQGKEIFRRQQHALELEERYAILKDELERTDEFLQMRHETRLGRWGWIVGLLALYYTVLPIVADMMEDTVGGGAWHWLGDKLGLGEWGALGLAILSPLALALAANRLFRR